MSDGGGGVYGGGGAGGRSESLGVCVLEREEGREKGFVCVLYVV